MTASTDLPATGETATGHQPIRSVCIYCGSRFGDRPGYGHAARTLGEALARAGITVVYGGGSIGLMGAAAETALAAGGKVIGIIPEHLDRVEITLADVTELHVTHNMHDRKRLMFERSDAFVIMPGGLGTLDETFEILTWAQLGLHRKPILLLNIEGYWQSLITLIGELVERGFASADHAALIHHADTVDEAMALIARLPTDPDATDSSLL